MYEGSRDKQKLEFVLFVNFDQVVAALDLVLLLLGGFLQVIDGHVDEGDAVVNVIQLFVINNKLWPK